MTTHVLFSRHDSVGLITLNRPDKLNAFADGMRDALERVIRETGADDRIRALVITGAGRAFCAGADVGRMHELVARAEWDALDAFVEAGAAIVRTIAALDKPVLAALNGVAAGGGANLALACDIRVAARSASIGQTFVRLGLQPDWGGTYFLTRLVGLGRALELALTGEILSATEALEAGLVNRVVDDDRVVEETMSLAGRIAARPPLAMALAKQSIRQACGTSLDQALEVERMNQGRLFRNPDTRDAICAFVEARAGSKGERT